MSRMHLTYRSLALALPLLLASTVIGQEDAVSFREQVAPLLINNCLACHGPKKAEGGYRVDSFERLSLAGDSGEVALTAGEVDQSELLRRIASDEESERMPLEGDPMPAEHVALIKQWIAEGAKYDAEDPKAPLASIIPAPTHPDPPEVYPRAVPVTALAFTPDGEQLVVGGYHELTVWSPADGSLLRRIKNVGQRTYALSFSPDGSLLAVGCGAPGRLGETRIFDPTSGELKLVLGTTSDVVLDVNFNPAGDRLAVASADGVIRVYEVASGDLQLTITSHSDWVMAIAWNHDGTRLASASRDKTSKVFDASNGELVVTYAGHGQAVKGVTFHPKGEEVFSGGGDNKVHRWKVEDGKKGAEIAFGGEVYKLARGADFFFATSADKSVRQYLAEDQKEVRKYEGHSDWALVASYHDGSKRLASGGFDGEVRVWNTEDGAAVVTFLAAPGVKKEE
jgi:WD40 repeat protein